MGGTYITDARDDDGCQKSFVILCMYVWVRVDGTRTRTSSRRRSHRYHILYSSSGVRSDECDTVCYASDFDSSKEQQRVTKREDGSERMEWVKSDQAWEESKQRGREGVEMR